MEETETAFLGYLMHPTQGKEPVIIVQAKDEEGAKEILKNTPGYKMENGKIVLYAYFCWGEVNLQKLPLARAK